MTTTCSIGCPKCAAVRALPSPATLDQTGAPIPAVAWVLEPCDRCAVLVVPVGREVVAPKTEEAP